MVANVLGWVVWSALLFIVMVWTYGCRTYARTGIGVSCTTLAQTLSLWTVAVSFLASDWPKLHILWVGPMALLSVPFMMQVPVIGGCVTAAAMLFGRVVAAPQFRGGAGWPPANTDG